MYIVHHYDLDRVAEKLISLTKKEYELGQQIERQFTLNILDGIDITDKEMGNKGGGTLAIRHALKNRHI